MFHSLRRRAAAALLLGVLLAGISAWAQAPQAAETFDAVWTIVRQTHFDPSFDLAQWDRTRAELRPKAVAAKNPGELRAVLADMLGRLGLSHFAVVPATPDSPNDTRDLSGHPGLDVRFLDGQLIVTAVDADGGAAAAGVRPGWIVEDIEGTPVSTLVARIPSGTPARLAQLELWRVAQTRLRGPSGSRATVVFVNGANARVRASIERKREQGEPVTVGSLPTMYVRVTAEDQRTPQGRPAGLIAFNVWMTAADRPIQAAVDRMRSDAGIVLDLRGNPGGLAAMIMGIAGHFVAERSTLGVMKTKDSELHFNVNPRLVSAAGQRVEPYGGPLAIIVDGMSGSASECFTGGMQSLGRARVFGTTSMGQALPALFDRLPNGDVLIHAWGDFVTGTGVRVEGRGVVPDETVPATRQDLLAGHDRPLEAALRWIDSQAGVTR